MIETPLQRRAPLPPQLNRRVGVLGVVVLVLFGVIAFRLWYLQVLTGTQNAAKATANVVRDISVAPPRGNILASNGDVLATDRDATEVAVVKDELPPQGPQRWSLYERLGHVLGRSPQEIRATVDDLAVAPPGYAPTPIAYDVSTYALAYLSERKRFYPGVVEPTAYVRSYPEGDIGAVMLGQVGQITGGPTGETGATGYRGIAPGTIVGQSGLEAEYQPYLQGTAGVQRVEVDSAGYPTGVQGKTTAPVPGDQLVTSIDLPLEREGYTALHRAEVAARANGDPAPAGAFVAMDPDTGRILALGSDPTYDANAFATPLSTRAYDAITAKDKPLFDRAIDGLYPTGSTFKPITAFGALRAGLINAQTTQGAGSCLQPIGGETFCNSEKTNYGSLDLVNALKVSEDTYFYLVGQAANGVDGNGHAIQDAARALGLGSSPGIDLPGGGAPGTVPDEAWVKHANAQIIASECRGRPSPAYRVACAQGYYYPDWTVGQNIGLATGQGYLEASPLQMAIAYSAIVNGGKVFSPRIGTQILSPSGQLVAQLPAPTYSPVHIAPAYQSLIMDGLHDAAQSPAGTSYAVFGSFPRIVYGKTGTAVRTGQKDQSWYVVYAPDATRPIVVAVTIEQGGFGAAAAAPAARLMLSQWFGLPKKFVVGSSTDL